MVVIGIYAEDVLAEKINKEDEKERLKKEKEEKLKMERENQKETLENSINLILEKQKEIDYIKLELEECNNELRILEETKELEEDEEDNDYYLRIEDLECKQEEFEENLLECQDELELCLKEIQDVVNSIIEEI